MTETLDKKMNMIKSRIENAEENVILKSQEELEKEYKKDRENLFNNTKEKVELTPEQHLDQVLKHIPAKYIIELDLFTYNDGLQRIPVSTTKRDKLVYNVLSFLGKSSSYERSLYDKALANMDAGQAVKAILANYKNQFVEELHNYEQSRTDITDQIGELKEQRQGVNKRINTLKNLFSSLTKEYAKATDQVANPDSEITAEDDDLELQLTELDYKLEKLDQNLTQEMETKENIRNQYSALMHNYRQIHKDMLLIEKEVFTTNVLLSKFESRYKYASTQIKAKDIVEKKIFILEGIKEYIQGTEKNEFPRENETYDGFIGRLREITNFSDNGKSIGSNYNTQSVIDSIRQKFNRIESDKVKYAQ